MPDKSMGWPLWLFLFTMMGCSMVGGQPPALATAQAPPPPKSRWVVETFPTRPKPPLPRMLGSLGAAGHAFFGFAAESSNIGELEIRFIDVGQGDTTAIKCPAGDDDISRVVIVDAGGSETATAVAPPEYFKLGGEKADAAKKELDELIAGSEVEALFLTHADRDHYNGLGAILGDVTVRNIYIAGPLREYKARGAKAWLDARNNVIKDIYKMKKKGEEPVIRCGSAKFQIFTVNKVPSGKSSHARNTKSLVLLISHGDADFLLTGDATKRTKRDIMGQLGRSVAHVLDAELLKLAHHGAANTLDTVWYANVKPTIAIISSMRDHQYGHPRLKVVEEVVKQVADAQTHEVSFHDGSCSDPDKSQAEDGGSKCIPKGWDTRTYDKALYGLGNVGTVTAISDGKTITIKYLGGPQKGEASSTGKKDYDKCIARNTPEAALWMQCHR